MDTIKLKPYDETD